MAFGAITTVYLPVAASAGSSLWGSDVRRLLESPDAAADTTNTTAHGTGGDTRRTVDPYTASSSDAAESDFGWAITPLDMGSTATEKRRQAAGDHTCTVRLSHSATLGDSSATLHFLAYKVGPAPDRTRTLLGSVNQSVSLGALGAEATYNAAISLPEIVYQDDETLQYGFEITASGQVLSGASTTFRTGTSGGVAIRVDFPRLDTIVESIGSAQGSGVITADVARIMAANGSSAGSTSVLAGVGGIAGTIGAAAGSDATAAVVGAISAATGAAQGESAALGITGLIKATEGAVDVGNGAGAPIYRRTTILLADD